MLHVILEMLRVGNYMYVTCNISHSKTTSDITVIRSGYQSDMQMFALSQV